MRKILIFFLLLFSVFTVISCDFTSTRTTTATSSSTTTASSTSTTTTDSSSTTTEDVNEEDPVTGTFERLFDGIEYRKITIEISSSELNRLNSLMNAHYAMYGNYRNTEYVIANMIYEDEEGTIEIDNVGLRARGNLSLDALFDGNGNLNMNSFKLSFRETFDDAYPENDGRRGFELKELDMKWNRNWDGTNMTESYALDMMNYYGVYAAETTHFIVSLKIDGVETVMGLYTGFEPIDDEFIERRYSKDANDGNLFKSLYQGYGPAALTLNSISNPLAIGMRDISINYIPSYDLKTNKDAADYTSLTSLIENINNLSGTEFQAYIMQNFDYQSFLMYLAVNAFVGNPDDYRAGGNNYFLYQDSETGVWRYIPYDFDHGLGQGWDPTGTYTIGTDIYSWFTWDGSSHPLVDKMMASGYFKSLYNYYLNTILSDSYFTYNNFTSEYYELKSAFENTYNTALQNQGFDLRNIEYYITAKRNDISNQLGL